MYNILVCDDEKDIVSALRIYLTAEGYRVFEAGNGAEALEVIDREDIHLALLDVMMPGMDGFEVVRQLRREHCAVPVLMLTAKSELIDKVHGLDMGADDYMTKPFAPEELLARVPRAQPTSGRCGSGAHGVRQTRRSDLNTCDLSCRRALGASGLQGV